MKYVRKFGSPFKARVNAIVGSNKVYRVPKHVVVRKE